MKAGLQNSAFFQCLWLLVIDFLLIFTMLVSCFKVEVVTCKTGRLRDNGLQMQVFCVSDAHGFQYTLRSGSRKPVFSPHEDTP